MIKEWGLWSKPFRPGREGYGLDSRALELRQITNPIEYSKKPLTHLGKRESIIQAWQWQFAKRINTSIRHVGTAGAARRLHCAEQ